CALPILGHKDHAENVAKAFHLCLPAILAAGGLDRSVFAEGRAGHSLPGRAGGTDLLVAVPHKAVDNNPLPRGSAARVGASAGTLRYAVRQPSRGPMKRRSPPAFKNGVGPRPYPRLPGAAAKSFAGRGWRWPGPPASTSRGRKAKG